MAKTLAYEQNLVSMVSSLIQLRTIGEQLGKKPFVIPRMAGLLADSLVEFEALQNQFVRTEVALQREAAPYLQTWLSAAGLAQGAEARFEGSFARGVAGMRGRLVSIALHPRQHGGMRCVELELDEVLFSVDSAGHYRPYEAFNPADLEPILRGDRQSARHLVPDAYGERYVVRVTLPIKKVDLLEMAHSMYYFRLA